MAIGRQILSGLFGATAGGLSGFAQQKAEERARMQRQMEREEERAYQRGLVAETRRYQEALAAQEGLTRGDLVPARRLAPEPEAEVATPESTAEALKSFITGARMGGAGVGLARGATDAAPFGPLASPDYDAPAISEKDRRDLRAVGDVGAAFQRRPEPLRAEYAKPETTAPERQAIELAGEKYEIVNPAERRARALEAERGGLDAIEVARLREVARGSVASPERETARAILSDIGVSYLTEEERLLAERPEPEIIRTAQGIFLFDPLSETVSPLEYDGGQLEAIEGTPAAPRVETYVDEEGYLYRAVVKPDGTASFEPVFGVDEHGEKKKLKKTSTLLDAILAGSSGNAGGGI